MLFFECVKVTENNRNMPKKLENSGGYGTLLITVYVVYKAVGSGGDRMIDFRELPFHEDDLAELLQLEIDFVFQPIFDTEKLEIIAYEALMRPKGKSPLELIDEYQKKDKLFVIELATCFGAAMEYRRRGYTKDICINSFPSEVLNAGQTELFFKCFPEMEGKIIVEMLEYTKLNKHRWSEKQEEISSHDMRLALDDYSTGNNDISAVEYFHPQYVKFDRTMISGIHEDERKQKKVLELIQHFHGIGIKVVAEGIETEEELNYLRYSTEMDYVQGYYLAVPR